jgi:hypothetical protein
MSERFLATVTLLRKLGGGEGPDNSLPGAEGPVDPGYGVDTGVGIDNSLPPGTPPIGSTLPEPPPGIWPPPSFTRPVVPIGPSHPIAPVQPGLPSHPIAGAPGSPSHPIAPPPGTIWPPVAGAPSGKFWIVAGIPGIGWRYVCIDPSLSIDNSLPGAPVKPDQGLPPTAAPKA